MNYIMQHNSSARRDIFLGGRFFATQKQEKCPIGNEKICRMVIYRAFL
ncbi:hypothetical protein [Ruminococcus sp.]|nr:hypothetical protein [Ruminococcus sp.]MBO4523266.1 hypothetical protein [Ruminococcus sp.]